MLLPQFFSSSFELPLVFPQLSRNRNSEHIFFFSFTKYNDKNSFRQYNKQKSKKKTCLLCKSSLLLPSLHPQLVLTSIQT